MKKKKLIKLKDHNAAARKLKWGFSTKARLNGIECPDCGKELYDTNPMVTLTSMPAQKNIHCNNCNYKGYRIA